MAGKKAKERAVMDGFADVKIILIYYKIFSCCHSLLSMADT